ncbi:MAG: EhaD family protein [Methanomicrobiales archaeon]|nr:EhaD family protein [Methanomicrobiales archaeon]
MDEYVLIACSALVLIGTIAAILHRDPFDKLISLSILIAGIFPFIVDRGYLDVAAATALIAPLSTIFILYVCRREGT